MREERNLKKRTFFHINHSQIDITYKSTLARILQRTKYMTHTYIRNLLFMLAMPMIALAQYTDTRLYQAYLANDMGVWDAYIHASNWEKADKKERARILNYEYGYVATAQQEKKKDAEWHLSQFEQHIEAMDGVLPASTVYTYRSAAASYRALIGNLMSNGVKALQHIKKARQCDSKDPLALNLSGCVEMYSPAMLGGSKKQALEYFHESMRIREAKGDTVSNWNYLGSWMSIAQCLEKTEGVEAAIRECERILRFAPTFSFIRDVYLPELKAKKKK